MHISSSETQPSNTVVPAMTFSARSSSSECRQSGLSGPSSPSDHSTLTYDDEDIDVGSPDRSDDDHGIGLCDQFQSDHEV